MINKKNRKERTSRGEYLVLGGLVAVMLLSGVVLVSSRVSAEESTSETVSVTVSSSCTITGTNTDHTTTAVNGNITPDIGLSTINARCNDASGFAIYAIGYTGDTDGNNKLVNSTLGPSADIATGTNTTGNSSWSMKLATTTSPEPTYPVTITTGYDDYHAVPDDYTLVVKRTAPTDVGTNATGAIFTTTYRAYISDTQPAGTYTGKVKYVLVHPNEAAAPQKPEAPLSQCTTPLSSKVAGITNMQDINSGNISTVLGAINTGEQYFLRDSRDNQPYCVSKLADGKLWMTENLNLAGGTALSADDTDVTSSYISSFSASNNLTKAGDTIVLPASSTSGFDTDNYSYVYNSGNKTNSCTGLGCYSYYSWDAATLGSGRTIGTDNTDAEQSICPKGWKLPSTFNGSGTAAEATDFRALMIGYGGSNSIQTYNSSTDPTGATMYGNIGPGTTPNFLLAGHYDYGSFYYGSSYGSYWSSTSFSSTSYARNLSFNSSGVYSANDYNRYYGLSVRCLYGS